MNFCFDCGKEICKTSKRCNSCNTKKYWMSSEYAKNVSIGIKKAIKNNPKRIEILRKNGERVGIGNKGKCLSLEHRMQIGKSHKGTHHSKEVRRKISIAQGGNGIRVNFYPIEFLCSSLRTLIRKRDNYLCAFCGKNGWHVHHIDYNKKNSDESNLIALCAKHNVQANFDRDKWQFLFTTLMEKRT